MLGRGGMGVVFRAAHLRLNRLVALKTLLDSAYCEPRERERFQREAEAVAGLRHENIVRVFDVGEHEGRPYFTMEYVEGGSLAQRLRGAPLGVAYAAALVATLAEAVQVAHQGGTIHRRPQAGQHPSAAESGLRDFEPSRGTGRRSPSRACAAFGV